MSEKTSGALPLATTENLVIQELSNEVLIYNLQTHKAYCLNEMSALVWQLCDGNRSVEEISQSISGKLKSFVTEDLVWLAIDQLKREDLLSNRQPIETKFEGLSRREVIRKIGLTSVVALPVISSLVAPSAAMARSGSPASSDCVSPGDVSFAIGCNGTQEYCQTRECNFFGAFCASGKLKAVRDCTGVEDYLCICV